MPQEKADVRGVVSIYEPRENIVVLAVWLVRTVSPVRAECALRRVPKLRRCCVWADVSTSREMPVTAGGVGRRVRWIKNVSGVSAFVQRD